MSPRNQSEHRLIQYLQNRFADDLAAGWELATHAKKIVLFRRFAGDGPSVREVVIPPYARPVRNTDDWHAAHQAGDLLPVWNGKKRQPTLFEREEPQPCLF